MQHKVSDEVIDKMLAKARREFPSVEQFQVHTDLNGDCYVDGCFDNSLGEFISTSHEDEYIPSSVWVYTGIDSSQFKGSK